MMQRQSASRSSYRVALGGIVAALCLLTMFLTGVLPVLYIVSPMLAGVLLTVLVEEVSEGWAALTYVAVSLLSLIVTYDKEAALMFILFFGYYPLLRPHVQHIRWRWLRTVAAYLLFNVFLVLDYLLTVYVLGLPTFEDTGGWMLLVLALAANAVFGMYDRLLGQIGILFRGKWIAQLLGRKR